MNVAQLIDHTLLKPEATVSAIGRLCQEALTYGFCSVCVNPCHVRHAADLLRGSMVNVGTVVGFPLGANLTESKLAEARAAIREGASEIDVVPNLGALKAGEDAAVLGEIRLIVEACHAAGARLKVILETALLSDAEKSRACELCIEGRADFVKTSTGFASGGATVEDVALLSRLVKPSGLGVKASGGIRTLADLTRMVAAGATRIGTSSGVSIMTEWKGQTVAIDQHGD